MKDIKYIIIACVCALFASCMGSDYAEPETYLPPYGNNQIPETNVVTIAALKSDARFVNVIKNGAFKVVTDDIKIKGRVTGNDIQGNLYNEFSIDDGTGAILVCVNQGGLYGYLPIGQEILIDLKGMAIGSYRQQPEIGGVYTNPSTGAQSVGRMSRQEWASHYKLTGAADPSQIVPEEFDVTKISDATYLAEKAGKLMTIKGVQIAEANGTSVFAPDDGSVTLTSNCANRTLKGLSSNNIVLRTSTYADFANEVMPTEKVNITGIFTRFDTTWQILLRSTDDIEVADPFAGIAGSGEGTEASPLDVTRALDMINKGAYDAATEYYVSGIISSIKEVSPSYGNATYNISVDGKDENTITVFRGKYLNGEKFTAEDQIKVGQKVVILGTLTLYSSTPEINAGNSIISIK